MQLPGDKLARLRDALRDLLDLRSESRGLHVERHVMLLHLASVRWHRHVLFGMIVVYLFI